jgi:hypothetical protein
MEEENKHITKGNIIIINVNDTEPSMAIIPKVDFEKCNVSDIFRKIKKLTKQFPNCNFKNCSFLFENKYDLNSYKKNISLSKWFQYYNIEKDEYNNYIFYIKKHSQKRISKKKQQKNKKNKSIKPTNNHKSKSKR